MNYDKIRELIRQVEARKSKMLAGKSWARQKLIARAYDKVISQLEALKANTAPLGKNQDLDERALKDTKAKHEKYRKTLIALEGNKIISESKLLNSEVQTLRNAFEITSGVFLANVEVEIQDRLKAGMETQVARKTAKVELRKVPISGLGSGEPRFDGEKKEKAEAPKGGKRACPLGLFR